VEICRREGFPWAATGAKHTFDGLPGEADWPRLMGAYAAEGARP
jgi:hypothetical protein